MTTNSQLLVNLGQGLSLMVGLPRLNIWQTGMRPKNPKRGMIGFNSETERLEYYNGEHWLAAAMSKG